MIIRMLIIHLLRHLLWRGGCIWIGRWRLGIEIICAVVQGWIRARMVMNWCWWWRLIKAIVVGFIVIVCVVVVVLLMKIGIVVPLSWLRLRLMVHRLHVVLLIVVPSNGGL